MSNFSDNLINNLENLNKQNNNVIKNTIKRLYAISDINGKQREYTRNFLISIQKSKNKEKTLQTIYNFVLNSEKMFVGKTIEKNNWYKGTAIAGMECSNPNR